MAINSFLSNQGTQTSLLTDNTGGTGGTLIPVMKIDTSAQGTAGSLWSGNVGVSSGTINLGTTQISGGTLSILTNGTLSSAGTVTGVGSVSSLGSLGMLNAGTLGTVAGVGSLSSLGSLGMLNAGTLGTVGGLGTLPGVGVVSVLSKGTISLGSVGGIDANATAQSANPVSIGGTDSGGTVRTLAVDLSGRANIGTLSAMPNIPGGTINILAGGTLGILTNGTLSSAGTVTGVGSVSNLGSMAMLTAGTVSMLNAGTISTLPNIPGGTINILAGGTLGILTNGTLSSSGTTTGVGTVTNLGSVTNLGQVYNAGTIQNILGGTIQQSVLPTLGIPTFGTHGTTGVSIFGTLAGGTGSGAGTEIFITSLSLTIPSTGGSQDASIGWGTNGGTFHAGTGLLVRGNFPPGGGIQKTFSYPYPNSGTNAQLCLFQAGSGTVDVSVTYFITPSTL